MKKAVTVSKRNLRKVNMPKTSANEEITDSELIHRHEATKNPWGSPPPPVPRRLRGSVENNPHLFQKRGQSPPSPGGGGASTLSPSDASTGMGSPPGADPFLSSSLMGTSAYLSSPESQATGLDITELSSPGSFGPVSKLSDPGSPIPFENTLTFSPARVAAEKNVVRKEPICEGSSL